MGRQEENRALVEEAYAAFERGDVETINRFLDPQIEVMISDELMNAGTWSGIDGFWQSVSSWLEAFGDYSVEVQSVDTPDDHHAIVEARQTATGKASGVPVELTTYFVYRIEDQRAVRYELHATRDDAMAAIRPE
jgi:ketosteroid isomerase-like protein